MAKPLMTDEVWRVVEPLLPHPRLVAKRGRPRLPDRACLTGILFVLKTGIPWDQLPCEAGCGSGMTCWRRLRQWQQAGTWPLLQNALVRRLDDADRFDWDRAMVEYPDRSARAPRHRQAS
jgi:transposase